MFNEYLENPKLSIVSSYMSKLVIFLFIIAGNYVGDIYSCELRHYFNNHMLIKHLIGFLIMFVFVGSIEENINTLQKIGLSIFFYVWFLFIMRTNKYFTLSIILFIVILFIINSHIQDLKKNGEEKNKKDILYYQKLMNFIFIINLIISIVGLIIFYLYTKEKIENFTLMRFLMGSRDQKCFTPEFAKIFSDRPMQLPQKIKKRMVDTLTKKNLSME